VGTTKFQGPQKYWRVLSPNAPHGYADGLNWGRCKEMSWFFLIAKHRVSWL